MGLQMRRSRCPCDIVVRTEKMRGTYAWDVTVGPGGQNVPRSDPTRNLLSFTKYRIFEKVSL